MRKVFWMIAFLGFLPCAKADTLSVTSGYIQIIGATGNNASFSGDGFTATGNVLFLGVPSCVGDTYVPGQPFLGCAGFQFPFGSMTVSMNGTTQLVSFGANFLVEITQARMFLSGATQATLTEPATIVGLAGCTAPAFFPPCPTTSFAFPGPVMLTVSLTLDPTTGNYHVTNEAYTITAPEPGTRILLLMGIGLLLVMGKRSNRLPVPGI
jgi:hypothetical protein